MKFGIGSPVNSGKPVSKITQNVTNVVTSSYATEAVLHIIEMAWIFGVMVKIFPFVPYLQINYR